MSLRSQGSVLLARTGQTMRAIGEKIGQDHTVAVRIISGERKPTKSQRDLLFLAYGIAQTSWDEEPVRVEFVPPKINGVGETREALTVAELAERIQRQAERSIIEIETDPAVTPLERDRRLERLTNIVKRLREVDLSPQQILKSSAMKRVVEVLIEALQPYPDALDAAATVLERLDEGSGR